MKFGLVVGALGALAIAAPASAAQILKNGDFENTGFGGTTTYYNVGPASSGPAKADHPVPADFGWKVPVNNVDIISYATYGPAPAGGGSYGLDLVGYGSTGEISQTFGTTAGRTYNVSFDYSSNPGVSGPTADVLVNGGAIGSVTGGTGWQTYAGTFVGTGSPMSFALNETSGSNNSGVFLDNVSITAVPEPLTWILMVGGIGMVGAGLRYGRRGAQAMSA